MDFIALGDGAKTLRQLVALPSVASDCDTSRTRIKRVHNLIERVNQKGACISSQVAEYDGFGRQTAPHRWVLHTERARLTLDVKKPKHRHAPLAARIRAVIATYGEAPLTVYDLAEEVGRTGPNGPTRTDRIAVAAACRRAGIAGRRVGLPGGGSELHFSDQITREDRCT